MLYGADTAESDSWCLIDEHWLTKWRQYVHPGSTSPLTGPSTNGRFLDPASNEPRPGMVDLYDYHGISPLRCDPIYTAFSVDKVVYPTVI
ncbi:hypothetical protein BLNAU_4321 [Blattamonas nauphoetae]|uniref:DUSP domain-containing protein n=1 Tax=Blattamonas nauphoetae TaxID=2049346 RepID=A0ABQ9YAG8_9EUKA|nr:hypothetical protein BLNAU_4321 [Blattamonas nauphoetae]